MPIHKGDIGTVFQFVLTRDGAVFDVSSASVKELRFSGSDKYCKVKTAAFTTDGTDGKIQYTTVDEEDLDCVGPLRIQGHVVLAAGEWSSDVIEVYIEDNLI